MSHYDLVQHGAANAIKQTYPLILKRMYPMFKFDWGNFTLLAKKAKQRYLSALNFGNADPRLSGQYCTK